MNKQMIKQINLKYIKYLIKSNKMYFKYILIK